MVHHFDLSIIIELIKHAISPLNSTRSFHGNREKDEDVGEGRVGMRHRRQRLHRLLLGPAPSPPRLHRPRHRDEKETKHLLALEGAESRLKLFQIDVLDYDSITAAVAGADAVFHLASPCIVDRDYDPEREVMEPAIRGTINVLRAAKELGVRRVVVTSSACAITPSPNWPADVVKGENCWTDEEYCKQKGLWYSLSKTLAEKAAWKYAKEQNLDVVVVNPGTVMGPILPPTLNASMMMILRLIQGCTETYEDIFMGCVHVEDAALAHILLYENKAAAGRHLCVEAVTHYGDFAAKVAELYPEYNIPRFPKDTQPGLLRAKDASKKLMDLGIQFIPMDQIIKDSVDSLRSKGLIP